MIQGTLSVVLPAHNEVSNLRTVVERAEHVLPSLVGNFEIVVVNDGSTDGTKELADHLASESEAVRVVHHQRNRGYGKALTSGFDASSGEWIMIMDSDQQFDIADLIFLSPFTRDHDLIAGYRINRNDARYRLIYAGIFRFAVRIMFGIRFRDIDCAFKLIRGSLIRGMHLTSPGALISTEILAKAQRAGARTVEIGVNHYSRQSGQSSGGSPKVILRAMNEILSLWFRMLREEQTNPHRGQISNHTGAEEVRAPSMRKRAALIAGASGVAIGLVFRVVLALISRDRNDASRKK